MKSPSTPNRNVALATLQFRVLGGLSGLFQHNFPRKDMALKSGDTSSCGRGNSTTQLFSVSQQYWSGVHACHRPASSLTPRRLCWSVVTLDPLQMKAMGKQVYDRICNWLDCLFPEMPYYVCYKQHAGGIIMDSSHFYLGQKMSSTTACLPGVLHREESAFQEMRQRWTIPWGWRTPIRRRTTFSASISWYIWLCVSDRIGLILTHHFPSRTRPGPFWIPLKIKRDLPFICEFLIYSNP